jgi:molecular chaperone DnaJ
MADKDFYEALGVARTDNEEEIRKAFRKKAMEFHPDRNKSEGAEDKFKEINEAYQVLSDPKKRAQYDRFGRAGVGSNGGQDRPFDGFDVFGGFGDIFDSFFGDVSGRRENRSQRGDDLQQRVILDFNEAVFGTEREVEITRQESCQRCSGAGNEPGSEVSSCTTCRGNGQVRRSQRSIFGQFAQVTPCPACRGSGKVIKTPCTSCRATGVDRRKRKIAVTIPAGVEAGMQVRLTGEGDTGRDGGPAGNLYVHLDVREHKDFYREGNDLLYALPVNVAEAALGVEKEVPTLDGGTEKIKVPQGTQPGAEFRIRGKGVPHLHGNRRGDLRVLVNLQVPQALDPEQRKLLEELALSLNSNQSGHDSRGNQDSDDDGDKGIFEKIKEVLS